MWRQLLLPVHGATSVESLDVPQALLCRAEVLLQESCLKGQLLRTLAEELRVGRDFKLTKLCVHMFWAMS